MDIDLRYLLDASEISLENALLNRQGRASAKRKHAIQILDDWAEQRSESLVLQWCIAHRRRMVTTQLPAAPLTAPDPPKPGPMTAAKFRESLRSLIESD